MEIELSRFGLTGGKAGSPPCLPAYFLPFFAGAFFAGAHLPPLHAAFAAFFVPHAMTYSPPFPSVFPKSKYSFFTSAIVSRNHSAVKAAGRGMLRSSRSASATWASIIP